MTIKNLFGKKSATRISLIAFLFATLFASFACKQHTEQQKKMLDITIKKDLNVESVMPDSFKIEKNSILGRSDILSKLKIKFKDGFECGKIYKNNESGYVITDAPKFKFSENTTLFIQSQAKSATPILTSLSIDGRQIAISDTIDAGKTQKYKVPVDVTCSPDDATIEFTTLDAEKNWILQNGEKMRKLHLAFHSQSFLLEDVNKKE